GPIKPILVSIRGYHTLGSIPILSTVGFGDTLSSIFDVQFFKWPILPILDNSIANGPFTQ
ncbi:MAG: hypothetical protein ABGW77_03655, partial [Campylobacterales bacterium]